MSHIQVPLEAIECLLFGRNSKNTHETSRARSLKRCHLKKIRNISYDYDETTFRLLHPNPSSQFIIKQSLLFSKRTFFRLLSANPKLISHRMGNDDDIANKNRRFVCELIEHSCCDPSGYLGWISSFLFLLLLRDFNFKKTKRLRGREMDLMCGKQRNISRIGYAQSSHQIGRRGTECDALEPQTKKNLNLNFFSAAAAACSHHSVRLNRRSRIFNLSGPAEISLVLWVFFFVVSSMQHGLVYTQSFEEKKNSFTVSKRNINYQTGRWKSLRKRLRRFNSYFSIWLVCVIRCLIFLSLFSLSARHTAGLDQKLHDSMHINTSSMLSEQT